MAIKIGSTNIQDIFVGSSKVNKVYLGASLAYNSVGALELTMVTNSRSANWFLATIDNIGGLLTWVAQSASIGTITKTGNNPSFDFSLNTANENITIKVTSPDNLAGLKLLDLYVADNPVLITGSSINSIDLSLIPGLEELNCRYAALPTIDLTNNTALIRFVIRGRSQLSGGITGFDKLVNLETVFIDDTQLASLDISNAPKIKELRYYNAIAPYSVYDKLVKDIDAHGLSNGLIIFKGDDPTPPILSEDCFTEYNNIVAKGWSIDIPAPQTPAVASPQYNIANLAYDSKSLSLSGAQGVPYKMKVIDDLLFVMSSAAAISLYKGGSANDITLFTHNSADRYTTPATTSPYGFDIKADKKRLFVLSSGESLSLINLPTVGTLTGATNTGGSLYNVQTVNSRDFAYSHDGKTAFILDGNTATIYQYSCPNIYSNTGLVYTGKSLVIAGGSSLRSMSFTRDGKQLFLASYANNSIVQYNLSTPYDISTGTQQGVKSLAGISTQPYGISVFDNKLILLDLASNTLFQFTLNT